MKNNAKLPPGFREAFDGARESTITALTEACSETDNVKCGPLDSTGMAGWNFEFSDPKHSSEMQGDLEYGVSYLRNMINGGFEVGFAAWNEGSHTLVCLKTWEPGDEEPAWPKNTDSATVHYHESPELK